MSFDWALFKCTLFCFRQGLVWLFHKIKLHSYHFISTVLPHRGNRILCFFSAPTILPKCSSNALKRKETCLYYNLNSEYWISHNTIKITIKILHKNAETQKSYYQKLSNSYKIKFWNSETLKNLNNKDLWHFSREILTMHRIRQLLLSFVTLSLKTQIEWFSLFLLHRGYVRVFLRMTGPFPLDFPNLSFQGASCTPETFFQESFFKKLSARVVWFLILAK